MGGSQCREVCRQWPKGWLQSRGRSRCWWSSRILSLVPCGETTLSLRSPTRLCWRWCRTARRNFSPALRDPLAGVRRHGCGRGNRTFSPARLDFGLMVLCAEHLETDPDQTRLRWQMVRTSAKQTRERREETSPSLEHENEPAHHETRFRPHHCSLGSCWRQRWPSPSIASDSAPWGKLAARSWAWAWAR